MKGDHTSDDPSVSATTKFARLHNAHYIMPVHTSLCEVNKQNWHFRSLSFVDKKSEKFVNQMLDIIATNQVRNS